MLSPAIRLQTAFGLPLLILIFSTHVSGRAELLSTAVAIAQGQVITSREVQMDALLEAVLYDKVPEASLRLLSIDSKAFNKTTQDVSLEVVISLEAHNFNVVQISDESVLEAERSALKTLKDNKYWRGLAISSKELQLGLRRKVQAKKFIQFRAQASVLPVTDSEALRYFNENRQKFGNLPFENYRENIKSVLARAQMDRRLKDWYDVLLNKYQVKNLIAEI